MRFLTIFLIAVLVFSTKQTSYSCETLDDEKTLLFEIENGKWEIGGEFKQDIKNLEQSGKPIYVISINGPTRTGKTWFIEKLSNMFEKEVDACFLPQNTLNSATKGIKYTIVSNPTIDGYILLLDSEGMDSMSKKADPKLLLINAMISQQLIYLTKTLDDRLVQHLSTVLVNVGKIQDRQDLNLDTIIFIQNKADGERDRNWIENTIGNSDFLKAERHILWSTFENRELYFVSHERDRDPTSELIEIKSTIEKYLKPFGQKFTPQLWLQFLETTLKLVNGNENIVFPKILESVYENLARQTMNELKSDIVKTIPHWFNEKELGIKKNQLLTKLDLFGEKMGSILEEPIVQIVTKEFEQYLQDIWNSIQIQNRAYLKDERASIQKIKEDLSNLYRTQTTYADYVSQIPDNRATIMNQFDVKTKEEKHFYSPIENDKQELQNTLNQRYQFVVDHNVSMGKQVLRTSFQTEHRQTSKSHHQSKRRYRFGGPRTYWTIITKQIYKRQCTTLKNGYHSCGNWYPEGRPYTERRDGHV